MSSGGVAWAEVAELLRNQRKLAQMSLRSLARMTDVSDSYLSQVERGLHQPSPEVLKAIARALGIPATALYERLGWLDAAASDGDAHDGGVEAAIERDARLRPAQKDALRAVYRALVAPE